MISYFDTSALVPTIIEEPTSVTCARMWESADRVISVRLLYPEARAALARAQRMGRLTDEQLADANARLEVLVGQVNHIEVSERLAREAGELARIHALRGYDAVHLAAASTAVSDDLVIVTGDGELADAARSLGIHVALATGDSDDQRRG